MLNNINLKYKIFLIFLFFPFLSILRLPTDSQPNALLFSFLILFTTKKILKFNSFFLWYFLIFFIAIIIFLFSDFNINNILNFSIYLSLLVIPYTVYFTLKEINGLPYNLFKNIVFFWGIVGLIQYFFDKNFLTFFIMRSSGNNIDGRGVGSLAPEPTYYGTICLFFLIIYFLNFKIKKDYFFIFFIILQIFLSKSSTIIFILLLSSFIYLCIHLIKFRLTSFFVLLFFAFLFIIQFKLFENFWEKTRFYNILNILIENPKFVLKDESISERINHTYFPILSLIENDFLPHKFGTFKNYIYSQISSGEHDILLNKDINTEHYQKIMNAYGSIIFDLGFIGVMLIISILKLFKNIISENFGLLIFLLFNFSLFTAISFNNALILFIIGNLCYLNSIANVKK